VAGGAAFTDTAGRTLSYTAPTTSTGGGTVTVNAASGAYTYTPTPTQRQTATATTTDTFTITANNGVRSATATITVPVSASTLTAPAIQINTVEPLSGTVKLSLSGSVSGAVTWYADLKVIGQGNSADGYSVSWPTGSVSNGDHQILARIQTGPNTVQEVQRTVSVRNLTFTLSASTNGPYTQACDKVSCGLINVDVQARSTLGIQRVTAQFDGNPFGTLTEPNAETCRNFCSDVYRFTVNAIDAGSGSHQMVITATDGGGSTRTVTVSVPVDNPPVLTLTSPYLWRGSGLDGGPVLHAGELSGSVRITGTAASDKTGAITTTAKLGDVPIYTTQGGTFDTTYSLTGVTPGGYVLTVTSTDSTGSISEVKRNVVVRNPSTLMRHRCAVFTEHSPQFGRGG
jgi:VCBS repeat-containing protein